MKDVQVSEEAYDRVMKNANGMPFDAALWMLIRDHESSKKMGTEAMELMLGIVVSKDKDDFKKNMAKFKELKTKDNP